MSVKKVRIIQPQAEFVIIDELVPDDHLVRKLEDAVDWNVIRNMALPFYSSKGRGAIDPIILFKMLVIKVVFGLGSMRRTCRECEVNVAYRWFLGLGLQDSIPNYSTWSQNYIRRYNGSEIFDNMFKYILSCCLEEGFVDPSRVYGDSTHQKASANKNKYTDAQIEVLEKSYSKELQEEIDQDRIEHGKKPLKPAANTEIINDEQTGEETEVKDTRNIKQSTTDPEAGLFHKGEKERCFAYSHTIFSDRNGFVLSVYTAPGNVHDSVSFFPAFRELLSGFPYSEEKQQQILHVVLDAGYKTPAIAREIISHGMEPHLPYKRPMTGKGFMRKYEYIYDEETDTYTCPNGQVIPYSTTDRNGYRQYKSDPKICESCPLREHCTKSKKHQKVIIRHIWEKYIDRAEEIRHTPEGKQIYKERKETVERVFAEDKENMGLRYTRLRGLQKNTEQALLIFSMHNLKKLALWKTKKRESQRKGSRNSLLLQRIFDRFEKAKEKTRGYRTTAVRYPLFVNSLRLPQQPFFDY